jgi:hypothetical protein
MTSTCPQCAFSAPSANDTFECRRRSPVAERVEAWQDLRLWLPRFPVMQYNDWCGEFQADNHNPERTTNDNSNTPPAR